ncbi:MAG: YlxM family DNA-binding protein [Lachnospiraceae bacterium]
MSTVEKIVEQSMLYDFYGELLTSHQQSIYEAALFEDLSLSEIAQDAGISRQGVHDLIKRCDKQLIQYESRLHLVERFTNARDAVQQICTLVNDDSHSEQSRLDHIEHIAKKLMEEL